MSKLQVIIERAEDNYSAYIEGIDGVVATGNSIDRDRKSEPVRSSSGR